MAAPGFAKSSYFLGGLGTTGLAATGIIGHSLLGTESPSDQRPKNYFFSDKLQNINPDFETRKVAVRVNNFLDLKSGDCFKTFFPDVADPGVPDDGTDNSSSGSYSNFSFSAEPQAKPIDCKIAKFSQTTDQKVFLYKSETTVKTEGAGWSMSVGVSNLKIGSDSSNQLQTQPGTPTFEFRLLFMEKTSSGWSIKGGYVWKRDMSSPTDGTTNFIIYGGNDSDKWLDTPFNTLINSTASQLNLESGYKEDSNWQNHRSYSGIWQASSGGTGQEIFDNDPLVKTWGLTGESPPLFPQIQMLSWYYSNQWRYASSNDVDLSQAYSPFRGKKGEWKDAKSYCDSFKGSENPESLDGNIRELCFAKNT